MNFKGPIKKTRFLPRRSPTFLLVVLAWIAIDGIAAAQQAETAKHFHNLTVADVVLSINPFAFEGLESIDMAALEASGVQRYCDGLSLCAIEAPVELPAGSVVTRIELDVVDESAENDVKANFYRCPIGSKGCELLADVTSSGAPGSVNLGVDVSPPETIDNQLFTYLFEVAPGDDASTRVTGARVSFGAPESGPETDTLAIHPFAHEARTSAGRSSLAADGIQRYCDGTQCLLSAPVELASGSRVTRIELDAVDDGTQDVELELSRCAIETGVCAQIAAVSTSGTPGATQIGIDLSVPETIDNATSTYSARVSLGQTSATRMVGTRINFDSSVSIPRYDRLAIGPFAFEGRSANDIAAAEAVDGDRYCDGFPCILIAPVELPTGTVVSRLELSAFDASTSDVTAIFSRCAIGASSCTEIAQISTSGTPGSDQPGIDLATRESIANQAATYQIAIELGGDSNTRVRAVSLMIENSMVFGDGFGVGDLSAWSSIKP